MYWEAIPEITWSRIPLPPPPLPPCPLLIRVIKQTKNNLQAQNTKEKTEYNDNQRKFTSQKCSPYIIKQTLLFNNNNDNRNTYNSNNNNNIVKTMCC